MLYARLHVKTTDDASLLINASVNEGGKARIAPYRSVLVPVPLVKFALPQIATLVFLDMRENFVIELNVCSNVVMEPVLHQTHVLALVGGSGSIVVRI